jgi:outer membrane protein TolC
MSIALIGCTPDAYKRSADFDVNKLLQDRKEKTIGYEPQAVATTQTPAQTTAKSFAKIPSTPLPPPEPSPIEPAPVGLPWSKLGPDDAFAGQAVPQEAQSLDAETAREPLLRSLRLGPPAVLQPMRTFDLFASIEYAVQHSRDYQTRMEDLYLGALDVTLERHLFSPRPFAQTSVNYLGNQQDSDVAYRSALIASGTAGIRQQLPYGGEIVASTLVNFINALNDNVTDGESASVALTASVPLLRGAGMVNLEPLISSERQLIYQVRTFERFRRDFVVNIASQYFRLLTQIEAIRNRRANYLSLSDLTERTEALYAAGRLNYLQVQRAIQQQLSGENALIVAQQNYEDSLDDFKVLLGMPVQDPMEVIPVELDLNVPDLDHMDATAVALRYRLDLTTAMDQVDDSRRLVDVAKNGLLPDLNLTAGSTLGNRVETPAREVDSRNFSYNAGITLDLPVDRVAERNAYRRSLINLERSQRNLDLTRDQITSDVRQAIRSIRSAQSTVEIQRRAVELAQRRLEYSTELLTQGRSTDSRDVTDAQTSLLSAQDLLDGALADLQIQVLQFLRDTGTLRVDPKAGALGQAMDRAEAQRKTSDGKMLPGNLSMPNE